MHWLYLGIAIVSEVVGTSALKAADGFRHPLPSLIVTIGYASAFYFMSLALRSLSLGITYAIWSGVGIVLISLSGWWLYGQRLDSAALLGMALIIAGVVVIYGFSKSIQA